MKFPYKKYGELVGEPVFRPVIPGLTTQARNAKELLKMTNDAVLTYLDVPKREASEIFNERFLD